MCTLSSVALILKCLEGCQRFFSCFYFIEQFVVCSLQCGVSLCSINYKVAVRSSSVQCVVSSVQFSVGSVQCTLCQVL